MHMRIAVLALFLATPAVAQPPPVIAQILRLPFADSDLVAQSVGSYDIEVVCPQHGFLPGYGNRSRGATERGARVVLPNSGDGYRHPGVTNALIRDAVQRIWAECPIGEGYVEAPLMDYEVGFVDITGPAHASYPLLVHAENWGYLDWFSSIRDDGEGRDRQLAAERQQAANAVAAAAQAREQDRLAEQARIEAAQEAQRRAVQSQAFWDGARFWLEVVAALAMLRWLWSRREKILYWFYMLTPHPATAQVHAAIRSGSLDGQALARSLGDLPSASRVQRAVRVEQAERLVREMQVASRAEIARMERQARSEHERAAVLRSQEAVALAASALARVRAAQNASRMT